ncbi:MAG: hypothetical protein RIS86_411 [Planctomycetota bacterium]
MQRASHFPTTHATELRTLAVDAAAGDAIADETARNLVMERYLGPLTRFVQGSTLRRLGDPADLVQGFFAERLSDPAYLRRWAASGMRLRRWLMNGILFHGQGVLRDRGRAAARSSSVDPAALPQEADAGADAAVAYERAWALAVVREATARAEDALAAEGRTLELEIFRRHAVGGEPYAGIARDLGRSEPQCAGATRLVATRVRAALAALLAEEGVPDDELEDEIARVRALVG